MQALAIRARDEAPALVELDNPEPGAGEVGVTVDAASVNGFDVAVAAGYVWDALPHEFPVVIGRDFAGTVASVGTGVEGISVGDRVTGVISGVGLGPTGTIAERFVARVSAAARVPDSVDPTRAAAIGLAGVAALDLVDTLEVQDGDVVVVSGATGGVGSFAVQLLAQAGARVIATARPGEASDFVRELGAAEVVDHTADLSAEVRRVAPDGVSKVVHAAGDAAELAALLTPGGRLASVLGADPAALGRDDVTVSSLLADPTTEKLARLLDAASSGRLNVPVAATYPVDRAAEALHAFGAGKLGKIVVTLR